MAVSFTGIGGVYKLIWDRCMNVQPVRSSPKLFSYILCAMPHPKFPVRGQWRMRNRPVWQQWKLRAGATVDAIDGKLEATFAAARQEHVVGCITAAFAGCVQ